jgi:hypothetical protein
MVPMVAMPPVADTTMDTTTMSHLIGSRPAKSYMQGGNDRVQQSEQRRQGYETSMRWLQRGKLRNPHIANRLALVLPQPSLDTIDGEGSLPCSPC